MLALALVSVTSFAAAAAALGPEESEALVRETWYEGLPLDRAAEIDADGAERLAALLADPDEREHHANILMALAASGWPRAYDAIVAWADDAPTGEVDRPIFRARQTLPYALGALAEHDARALERLAQLLDAREGRWHFRHHTPARVRAQARRGAATGLAMSGRAEADALLEATEASADGALRAHVRAERARLARDSAGRPN